MKNLLTIVIALGSMCGCARSAATVPVCPSRAAQMSAVSPA